MKKTKQILYPLLLIAAMLISGIIGYYIGNLPAETPAETSQRLNLSVVRDNEPAFTTFKAEDLDGSYPEDITYNGVSQVTITIDGVSHDLIEAIQDGRITVEEIFAYARIDARNGICKEICESELGLNRFVYQYPTYDIMCAYDVFETPSGRQHLVNDFAVYAPNKYKDISYAIYDRDENGFLVSLRREDWGLTFEAAEVTAQGLTLNCVQSGGNQVGELFLDGCMIAGMSEKNSDFIQHPSGLKDLPIALNEVSEFTLDWSEELGDLPSGDYYIRIFVLDKYKEDQLHPYQKKYTDNMSYNILFTIP